MHTLNLSDQVIAITGGFGSLGMAVAKVASQAGAIAALIDREAAPASDLAPALLFGGVDLSSVESTQTAFNDIARRCGRINALVNVAGTFRWEKIEDGDVHTWDLLYNVNLRTALNASRAALPHLLKQPSSRIVNIGAGAAAKAALGMGAYAASKSGVARLTEAMAEEFKDRGLTVNAVLPSIIDTPPNRADMPTADFSRWVKAEDIANLIVFLLSGLASAINGASIPIVGRV
ncbi:MAG: SDR family NAD(P)-dependent oxidoreductase [Betaproteobacteria bacterium]|nr:SDR family NAD(P)-dependent oxidoreductase [Betaproteobacteria bacterium]